MNLTIDLPDEIGRRLRRLPDPHRFVADALTRALAERPADEGSPRVPSRWARLAERVAKDPDHLDGYASQLARDGRIFRDDFAFRHDRGR